jgi:hypothetical protein
VTFAVEEWFTLRILTGMNVLLLRLSITGLKQLKDAVIRVTTEKAEILEGLLSTLKLAGQQEKKDLGKTNEW